jgi:type VI secretion system protein ImpC
MPGRLDFDLTFGRGGGGREESDPMRLLVLGDFSGKPAGERAPLDSRSPRRVDADNIDDVMRRFEPRVKLEATEIRFQQIDDFHPDQLYARLDRFKALREARTAVPAESDDQLSRLLGAPGPSAATPAPARPGGFEGLIHDAVAPHIVKDTSARIAAHQAATDAAIAHEMRTVLHDPAFQQIEANWRGVRWLIAGLELDENLQLHLLDVTRDELLGDIVAAKGKLSDTGLYRALVDRLPDGDSWSTLVALFTFGPSNADVALLAALGLIASKAGGPLLGDADLALATDDASAAPAWQALRRTEAARWIGLAAPRVLLRSPYGERTDPIDAFTFEEVFGAPAAGDLLWGSAALGMALLLGRSFTARGWNMEPGDEREIGGLPVYTFVRDGEHDMQPCAERALTEREIDTFLRAGLVPIASRRDRDSVVVVRFQSVSDPAAPLVW